MKNNAAREDFKRYERFSGYQPHFYVSLPVRPSRAYCEKVIAMQRERKTEEPGDGGREKS